MTSTSTTTDQTTILRFERTVEVTAYGAQAKFSAIYLSELTSRNRQDWMVVHEIDGRRFFESDFAMRAEASVEDRGYLRGDDTSWVATVTQSSSGHVDPRLAIVKAQLMLMAAEWAETMQEHLVAGGPLVQKGTVKTTVDPIDSYNFPDALSA